LIGFTRDQAGPRLYHGWWVVGALFAINLLTAGVVLRGMTVFFLPLREEFGLTATSLTAAALLPVALAIPLAPLLGIAFARFDPRVIIGATALLTGTGLLLLATSTNHLMIFGALLTVALGVSPVVGGVGPTIAARWFVRRRGVAIGLVACGFGLGGVIVPAMTLIEQSWGWRTLALLAAGAFVVIPVSLGLLVRGRPEDLGLRPDGYSRSESAELIFPGMSARSVLQTTAFWRTVGAAALAGVGGHAVALFFVPHLTSGARLSATDAASAAAVVSVANVAGQLICGWSIDRFKPSLVMTSIAAITCAGLFAFALATGPVDVAVFVVLFGLAGRASFGAASPTLAHQFGVASFGQIQGVLLAATGLSGLIAALSVGVSFDALGSYRPALLAIGIVSGLGSLVALGIKTPHQPTRPSSNALTPTTERRAG
jgi:sugar phosphate permease